MAGKSKKDAGADTTTSVDGGDAIIDTANIDDGVISADVTTGDENGTVVPVVKSDQERRAVVFLGPYHRYSRADVAAFDAEYAEELVKRKIAAWPEDAKRALNPRRGDDDHETDIG
ncbi:hypothetical protein NNO02_10480 [Citrobacter sp. Awk 2]|uniref:hypothetical protein n=1 Tax=Citrobacter sp. Awk 2 TaxID=2963959 RepID=UPI0023044E59|nr:hypothetical protein [Citrobacter sp. Awk 2]MDA8502877.1 hypothetical protein [Citrobacter sp. Awk 2]